jgi:hypothetical protein
MYGACPFFFVIGYFILEDFIMTFEVRNLRYTIHNLIDCEINHQTLGWIPFTADPNDTEGFGRAVYQEIKDRLDIAPYVAPPPPDLSAIDSAMLNTALVEPGSVVRALGLVMFQEINKLRVTAGLAQYPMDQFIAALKANMR